MPEPLVRAFGATSWLVENSGDLLIQQETPLRRVVWDLALGAPIFGFDESIRLLPGGNTFMIARDHFELRDTHATLLWSVPGSRRYAAAHDEWLVLANESGSELLNTRTRTVRSIPGGNSLQLEDNGLWLVANPGARAWGFEVRRAQPVLVRSTLVTDAESNLALGRDGWLRRASTGARLQHFDGTFWVWSPETDEILMRVGEWAYLHRLSTGAEVSRLHWSAWASERELPALRFAGKSRIVFQETNAARRLWVWRANGDPELLAHASTLAPMDIEATEPGRWQVHFEDSVSGRRRYLELDAPTETLVEVDVAAAAAPSVQQPSTLPQFDVEGNHIQVQLGSEQQTITSEACNGRAMKVSVSPRGTRLAAVCSGAIQVWSTGRWDTLLTAPTLSNDSAYDAPAFDSSERFIALTDGNRFVHLFDVDNSRHVRMSILSLNAPNTADGAATWHWYAETPEGLLDGSPAALSQISFPRSEQEGGTVSIEEAAHLFGVSPVRKHLLRDFAR